MFFSGVAMSFSFLPVPSNFKACKYVAPLPTILANGCIEKWRRYLKVALMAHLNTNSWTRILPTVSSNWSSFSKPRVPPLCGRSLFSTLLITREAACTKSTTWAHRECFAWIFKHYGNLASSWLSCKYIVLFLTQGRVILRQNDTHILVSSDKTFRIQLDTNVQQTSFVKLQLLPRYFYLIPILLVYLLSKWYMSIGFNLKLLFAFPPNESQISLYLR